MTFKSQTKIKKTFKSQKKTYKKTAIKGFKMRNGLAVVVGAGVV